MHTALCEGTETHWSCSFFRTVFRLNTERYLLCEILGSQSIEEG